MIIDLPFILASAALGFGLSLALYRWLAEYNEWPMGYLHAQRPLLPIILELGSVLIALAFAAARGVIHGGWGIVLFGMLWALFWLGFFRVGSQLSLLLAPASAAFLLFSWFGSPTFFHADWLRASGFDRNNVERIQIIPKVRDSEGETRYDGRDPQRDVPREPAREPARADDPLNPNVKR